MPPARRRRGCNSGRLPDSDSKTKNILCQDTAKIAPVSRASMRACSRSSHMLRFRRNTARCPKAFDAAPGPPDSFQRLLYSDVNVFTMLTGTSFSCLSGTAKLDRLTASCQGLLTLHPVDELHTHLLGIYGQCPFLGVR